MVFKSSPAVLEGSYALLDSVLVVFKLPVAHLNDRQCGKLVLEVPLLPLPTNDAAVAL
jgi:hypothetical protein